MTDPKLTLTSEIFRQALIGLRTPYDSVKLPSWPVFTKLTGGFRPGEYTVFCGSTGAGKTTFMANISAQLLQQGVKHFVVNVETGPEDFMRRVLSVLENQDINTGEPLSQERVHALALKHKDLMLQENIVFSTAEDRIDHKVLIEHLREANAQGCKVAFVDNLNFLMRIVSGPEANAESDRVTHDLIMLTKEIPLHIVMVMHPKKTECERVESSFDVKGSSTAVQEAHNVLLFNRLSHDDKNFHPSNRDLKIAKSRRLGKWVGSRIYFCCTEATYREFKPK